MKPNIVLLAALGLLGTGLCDPAAATVQYYLSVAPNSHPFPGENLLVQFQVTRSSSSDPVTNQLNVYLVNLLSGQVVDAGVQTFSGTTTVTRGIRVPGACVPVANEWYVKGVPLASASVLPQAGAGPFVINQSMADTSWVPAVGASDPFVIATSGAATSDTPYISFEDSVVLRAGLRNQGCDSLYTTLSVYVDSQLAYENTNIELVGEKILPVTLTFPSNSFEPGAFTITMVYRGQATRGGIQAAQISEVVNVRTRSDLIPFKPSSWGSPLVVTNVEGSRTDAATVSEDDSLFVSFSVKNQGTGGTFYATRAALQVGSRPEVSSIIPVSAAGQSFGVVDYSIGKLAPGIYQLRLTVDADDDVPELQEGNQVYTRTLVVSPRDGDGDGLPDSYEASNGLNPNDPADGDSDNDFDSTPAWVEYRAGTNPRNFQDGFRLSLQVGSLVMGPIAPGVRYVPMISEDLSSWRSFGTPIVPAAYQSSLQLQVPTGRSAFFKVAFERP